MNRPFFKQITASFIKDNPELISINKKLNGTIQEDSYNHLVEFMESLKLQDFSMYESLCNFDRFDSHKLSYFLLDEYYQNELPDIFESNIAIEFEGGYFDYAEEGVLSDIGEFIGGAAGKSMEAIGGALGSANDAALKNPTTAFWITIAFSAMILSNIGTSVLSRLFQFIGDIGKSVDKVLNELGSRGRVMRAVLFDRVDRCSKTCGIEKLSAMAGATYMIKGSFSTKKSETQVQCLSYCYIEHIGDIILLLVDAYQKCIVNTGELPVALPDKSSLLVHKPIGASCSKIYDHIKDAVAAHDEAIDRLIELPREKANIIKDLNSKLAKLASTNILNVMNQKQSFDKPIFKKQYNVNPGFGKR